MAIVSTMVMAAVTAARTNLAIPAKAMATAGMTMERVIPMIVAGIKILLLRIATLKKKIAAILLRPLRPVKLIPPNALRLLRRAQLILRCARLQS